MIDLSGKRILVTGASSGIGRAIAQQVAALGARVILFGRNIKRLTNTFKSLPGGPHELFQIDVTDYDRVAQIIHTMVAENGPITGFVHSAGIEKTLPLKASTPAIFREVFEINTFAGFEIARIISGKKMYSETGTSFVFLSSVMGKFGDSGKMIYCASKGALLSGTKAMAIELAPKNIRCNCILSGIVETEMVKELFRTIPLEARDRIISKHPLGLGKPSDVAELASFLLSDKAGWITGSDFVIDGGYSAQ
jgi:NAD(P)-dependent dehydrogenase (short-subunit alcohol dehydrogenase family)